MQQDDPNQQKAKRCHLRKAEHFSPELAAAANRLDRSDATMTLVERPGPGINGLVGLAGQFGLEGRVAPEASQKKNMST